MAAKTTVVNINYFICIARLTQKCPEIQSQRNNFSKISWRGMPPCKGGFPEPFGAIAVEVG